MVSTALIIITPSHSEANAASNKSDDDTHVAVEKSNGKSNFAKNSNGAHVAKGLGKDQVVGHKSLLKSDDLYKNTIEVEIYIGYSLLSTALALPDDGKVIAMDIHRKNFELGYPSMEQAGVAHKIDFREGPGLDTLDALLLAEYVCNINNVLATDLRIEINQVSILKRNEL
ncbi:hypothetical protein O6H91_23G070500 [Diphasiastrum complanatum]|uniref:Uncharacterized protein n=1 Tax=Diphasiastrum complanatum TaxID=34168 RepID=A0ACC2AC27_DIPCM|nr:hypothetical protein O6H91_23G070500 [Diphasiastrum complanatum]